MIKTRKPGLIGIAGQTWSLPVLWVAVVALVLGAAAPMSWADDDDDSDSDEPAIVELEEAEVFIEWNSTDTDFGIHWSPSSKVDTATSETRSISSLLLRSGSASSSSSPHSAPVPPSARNKTSGATAASSPCESHSEIPAPARTPFRLSPLASVEAARAARY